MLLYLFVFLIAGAVPALAFAQFTDKGEYVEVTKGTKLCTNVVLETSKGVLDAGKAYWLVTTKARANGTQAVDSFIHESVYDRQTGDTTVQDHAYDEAYAVRFKRDPAHKGMLLMISLQDGRVEATDEVCSYK